MPPRHFVQWIEVFVTLGMGVLHRHLRAKLDMLPDRLSERLIIRICEYTGIESLLQSVQCIETTGVFEKGWHLQSSLMFWSPP
jgi:hypothetical protein